MEIGYLYFVVHFNSYSIQKSVSDIWFGFMVGNFVEKLILLLLWMFLIHPAINFAEVF